MKKSLVLAAACSCSLAGVLALGQVKGEAADLWDVQNHWAKPYIEYMDERGAVNGYDDGSFKPENKVTYGEAIKLIMATFDDSIQVYQGGHWATNFLVEAEKAEVVNKGQYDASMLDQSATRKEVAFMMYNSLVKEAHKPTLQYHDIQMNFSDLSDSINEGNVDYYNAIKNCYLLGIMIGNDDGTMKPDMPITRAEMVTMLSRAYSEDWRTYPTVEKFDLQVADPQNSSSFKKIWAYMPNSFYEAGQDSWAKYVGGGYPANFLDPYKRVSTNEAMLEATATIEKGMSALLNVSYKMTDDQWNNWKETMAIFVEPAGIFDYYIQYVKDNKIEVRGGVIVNPCTIGTVYTNEKEGTTQLAIKGIIDYEVVSNPKKLDNITYDKFIGCDIQVFNDYYTLIYLGIPNMPTDLYNVQIRLENSAK